MTKIDRYIIRKFLGTYIFTILLVIAITVVFDFNEKIDYFVGPKATATMRGIIFDYYLNFIPYFISIFSPLFTFITVIFFTSQLADRSEIIAMLASGISFRRLMRPYLIGYDHSISQLCTECVYYPSGEQGPYRVSEYAYPG